MARLKTTTYKLDAGLEQFEPEVGRELLDVFVVETEGLIVVEELQGEQVCWTLLSMPDYQKIPTSQRYKAFNAKNRRQHLPANYTAVENIEVNQITGFEMLTETVFKDNDERPLFTMTRPRYAKNSVEDLWLRFCNSLIENYESQQNYKEHLETFFAADLVTKSLMLGQIFRKQWRVNSEQGMLSPEFFLSAEQFNAYDNDPDFRGALAAVVRSEASALGIDSELTLQKILDHYAKS